MVMMNATVDTAAVAAGHGHRMSHTRIMMRAVITLALVVCVEGIPGIPRAVVNRVRRFTNLSSFFASQQRLAKTPYERIAGHPVFQVTTSWGAPYMNFEPNDVDGDLDPDDREGRKDTRPVTLYYLDPAQALQVHQEMKQMSNLGKADIRITTTTLAKAIRQASHCGTGLLTGSPVDPKTGKLPSTDDGGSLRHKLVPSRRQLYYATRCIGRERVGFFGPSAQSDATLAAIDDLETMVIEGKRDTRPVGRRNLTPSQEAHLHMQGELGIPVFYAPEMRKRLPWMKRVVSGTKEESPVFFSYEDMMEAWGTMRKRAGKKATIPARPATVEVFNLMDILSSMDREDWSRRKGIHWKNPIGSIKNALRSEPKSGLESITFIPPKYCVDYKDKITAQGNGKARLRPMR